MIMMMVSGDIEVVLLTKIQSIMKFKIMPLSACGFLVTCGTFFSCSIEKESLNMKGSSNVQNCVKETVWTRNPFTGTEREKVTVKPCDKPDCPAKKNVI